MRVIADWYHGYRHRRFVRRYKESKDTRWAEGVYLRRGGMLRSIHGVEGTTWTLDGAELVDTRDIHHMVCARIELGYC